jgi:hypothetical protein
MRRRHCLAVANTGAADWTEGQKTEAGNGLL